MSTKTLEWLVGARDGKKLGSIWDPVNSIPTLSQQGPFQTFASIAGSTCPYQSGQNVRKKNYLPATTETK